MGIPPEGGHGAVKPTDVESPARARDRGSASGAEPAAGRATQQGQTRAILAHAATGALALPDGAGARMAAEGRDRVTTAKHVQRTALRARRNPQCGGDGPAIGAAVLSGLSDATTPTGELAQSAGLRVSRQNGEPTGTRDVNAAVVRTERQRTSTGEVATGRAAIGQGSTYTAEGTVQLTQNSRPWLAPKDRDRSTVAHRGIDIPPITSDHQARNLVESPARLTLPGAALGDARVRPRKRFEVGRPSERQAGREKGRKHAASR